MVYRMYVTQLKSQLTKILHYGDFNRIFWNDINDGALRMCNVQS